MRRHAARFRAPIVAAVTVAAALVGPDPARAADLTDIPSSVEKDHPFGLNLRAAYEFLSKTAAIKRDHEGDPGQTDLLVLKDLVYRQQRHTLDLGVDIGIWHDLAITVGLPLVLNDDRTLEYDQRQGAPPCTGAAPTCVDANNSSTTNDQITGTHASTTGPSDPNYIVPFGGYDALTSTSTTPMGFPSTSNLVFRGPHRGGSGANVLDTLNLGIAWAPFSQKRDPSKPTWLLAAEYRVSVGTVMAFDRTRPDANHGVSDGLDHVYVRTAVSRRFAHVDPYVQFWFDYPIVRRSDTLFVDLGPTARNSAPQMSAGTRFGFEAIPWERPKEGWKVAFDLGVRVQAKFQGRGYSEIWEMLASSPALGCDATWNPSCALDSNPYKGKPYSGITTIENYGSLGLDVALVLQMTRWFRLRLSFGYQRDQGHVLTLDDVGVPSTTNGRVSQPGEFNPAFRPVIDQIGQRYHVDDVDVFRGGLFAQLMF